jgi:hypothetical protein
MTNSGEFEELRDGLRRSAATLDHLVDTLVAEVGADGDGQTVRALTLAALGAQGIRDLANGVAYEDSPLSWYFTEPRRPVEPQ